MSTKRIRIRQALLDGDKSVPVYVEELGATFHVRAMTRAVRKAIKADGLDVKALEEDEGALGVMAETVAHLVDGWDEDFVTAEGDPIPYSEETLRRILQVPEVLVTLANTCHKVGISVEEAEAGN